MVKKMNVGNCCADDHSRPSAKLFMLVTLGNKTNLSELTRYSANNYFSHYLPSNGATIFKKPQRCDREIIASIHECRGCSIIYYWSAS